jgi:hypothetical protein
MAQIEKIEALVKKGVTIPNPASVEIGADVDIDRISGNGVIIHSGCRILGKKTLILKNVNLGSQGPVAIDNCQIGTGVDLKGGFFQEAVFLKDVSMGFCSHVRGGTILEEGASVAHTVGLKQTILFPFVTLGSLINFCDCFMAGGTDSKNHSEVGSSFIHFNYTPNQDKATASLIGDVPRGVMLDQKPIFLGGQGGLVGPCRLEYGTITGAGTIYRKDELRQGRLIVEGGIRNINISYSPGIFTGVKRILNNNVIYIANLVALKHWYNFIRSEFISEDFPETLLAGLKEKLDMAIEERIKKLKEFICKAYDVGKQNSKTMELYNALPELEKILERVCNVEDNMYLSFQDLKHVFIEKTSNCIKDRGKDYIVVINGLSLEDKASGVRWLQTIVDHISLELFKIIPSFGIKQAK